MASEAEKGRRFAREFMDGQMEGMAAEWIARRDRDEVLARVVADYDRRMSTRRGRFLLWLLRKTT